MFEELQKLSRHFLEIKNSPYRRYFIQNTKLNHRMSLIVGQRGIGKTTTLVQFLLDSVDGDRFDPRILYIQADHFLMGNTALYEVVEQFQMMGGKTIAFVEIHKYPEWSKELKSIYDTFPSLTVLASGSSALEIHKGSHDLARRSAVYSMQGMSLREYLELAHQIELPVYEVSEICANHEKIADEIVQKLGAQNLHIVPEFHRYLKSGYFPYFYELQDEAVYKMTLEQAVHTTIRIRFGGDLPSTDGAQPPKDPNDCSFSLPMQSPFTPQLEPHSSCGGHRRPSHSQGLIFPIWRTQG